MDDYSNRTLTAFFDDRTSADAAVAQLRQLGISEGSVRVAGGDEYAGRDYHEDKGFWESVADFFFPPDDSAVYAEGLRRGGYLVTLTEVPAETYDQAVEILDAEGSVDLDERTSAWREEGWTSDLGPTATGGTADGGIFGGETPRAPGVAADETLVGGTRTESGFSTAAGARGETFSGDIVGEGGFGTAADRRSEDTIPVVEERLRVGKRDVNLGRVRVRSYIVEEPVSEEVRLREDRVEIERRPVDRALGAGESAFEDRTIEAEEHAEEAIVSKEARVTEEIGLRRDSRERAETVSDSVRRTEVEVEDDRDVVSPDERDRRGA
jgi:uncharacterized protein (TIGR02271 family)